jgi:TolA-binding protein
MHSDAMHRLSKVFVKGDDAAFKIGESYEKMGNRASAKTAYQRLLTSYPESEYRSRVEARLRKL